MNTKTEAMFSVLINSINKAVFCFLVIIYKDCVITSKVITSGAMSILMGLNRISLAKYSISLEIVAENKSVCLFLGTLSIILLTSLINPISNIISASSITKYST